MGAMTLDEYARESAKIAKQDERNNERARAASMRLLKASEQLTQAKLIRIFESANRACLREIERLEGKELVSVHAEAASNRIRGILGRMRGQASVIVPDLMRTNYIIGRVNAKTGALFGAASENMADAFSLAQGDEKRVKRLVAQLMSRIDDAADRATAHLAANLYDAYDPWNASGKPFMTPDNAQMSIARARPTTNMSADLTVYKPDFEYRKSNTLATEKPDESGLTEQQKKKLYRDPFAYSAMLVKKAREQTKKIQQEYVIGRREKDYLRQAAIAHVAIAEAQGKQTAASALLRDLCAHGIDCFTDRAGKRWDLVNYCCMVSRTVSAQASNVGTIFDDEGCDLYIVVPHQTNCPICAPFEGRVFSRSGLNPYYPPLSDVFGKIDKYGDNSLENTWLTIHPNCRHSLAKYIERAYTPMEVAQKRAFSSKTQNPYENDPRSEQKQEEYTEYKKVHGRRNRLRKLWHALHDFMGDWPAGDFEQFEVLYAQGFYSEVIEKLKKAKARARAELRDPEAAILEAQGEDI